MTGESSSYQSYTREESLKTWRGGKRPDFEGNKTQSSGQPLKLQVDVLELSDQGKSALAAAQGQSAEVAETDGAGEFELSDKDKQKIQLIQRLLEALTGKKIKFYVLDKVKWGSAQTGLNSGTVQTSPQAQQRQGWGLEYDLHEAYYEQEKMSFAAEGIVKTADGREINFTVQMNMSREFAARQDISFRAGDAAKIDPLVINFSGTAPELTSDKFSFDLDSDGKEDQISFVSPGSGFLAIDLDGDNQIDNGSELFGPNTGDGFTELAEYDEDGNNWIDENDSIYDRLRIWTKDAAGNDVLFALGQKGVGAIYLGNTSTSFEMKDSGNNLQGQVKNSGVFLYESGLAGTIQQIDLAV
jgi:hypothetical protein